MRLRPYQDKDFEIISKWITDERSHALWCANILPYPLKKGKFDGVMKEMEARYEDSPFVATTDEGQVIGFFSFSVNLSTNIGMLKFVVVDNTIRSKGYGYEMLRLATKYAFEVAGVDAVQLNVYPENPGAKRCYEKVGFVERSLTENAFTFKDESWGRCNMIITR